MWSLGLDLDIRRDGISLTLVRRSTRARPTSGSGTRSHFRPRLQLELVPRPSSLLSRSITVLERGRVGNGGGVGARLALTYTFVSGLQVGLVAAYSLRWVSLAGDCTGCATGMPFSADVTMQLATVGVSLGKRSR